MKTLGSTKFSRILSDKNEIIGENLLESAVILIPRVKANNYSTFMLNNFVGRTYLVHAWRDTTLKYQKLATAIFIFRPIVHIWKENHFVQHSVFLHQICQLHEEAKMHAKIFISPIFFPNSPQNGSSIMFFLKK